MSIKEKLEEIKILDGEILALTGDEELDNETARTTVPLAHNKVRLPKLTTPHSNDMSEQENEESHDATDRESDQLVINSSRPRRSAASRARDHILAQAMSGWKD